MSKRLLLYLINDKDGIVDDYVPFALEALSEFSARLLIAVNGQLDKNGRARLEKFTKDIFLCPSENNVLSDLVSLDEVTAYDKLLICGDNFYGPFFPFAECFGKMDKCGADFWTLTSQPSMFVNFNRPLLISENFRSFWENELVFAPQFVSYFSENFRTSLVGEDVSFPLLDPVKLLKEYRCPLIERRAFAYEDSEDLQHSGNERKNLLMQIIENETSYDINLIWDNLLRVCDIYDIKNTLHLNYIFPTKSSSAPANLLGRKKTLVLAHLYYLHILDECLAYLDNVPPEIDIIVTTGVPQIFETASIHLAGKTNAQVRLVKNHGRDVAALLIACQDVMMSYDYLCFTHDKDANAGTTKREAESFRYLLWENTLASSDYVANVINEFEKSPRLGFLAVPRPYHGVHFVLMKNEWLGNLENARDLLKRLGLSTLPSKSPFCVGTAFWCRVRAMKPLFEYNWTYEDFPPEPLPTNGAISHAIERIFPNVAQSQCFYSGIMLSDAYAAVRMVDFERVLGQASYYLLHQGIDSYDKFFRKDVTVRRDVIEFCRGYKAIYIYGAGCYGSVLATLLESSDIQYEGFIVSDGMAKPDNYVSHPVFYLSEVNLQAENVGVIIALSTKTRGEVLATLQEQNLHNVFCFGEA